MAVILAKEGKGRGRRKKKGGGRGLCPLGKQACGEDPGRWPGSS